MNNFKPALKNRYYVTEIESDSLVGGYLVYKKEVVRVSLVYLCVNEVDALRKAFELNESDKDTK